MTPEEQGRNWHLFQAFKTTVMSHLGRPYVWGGDDPSGFDCSGLIVEGLKAAGQLGEKDDKTADGLWYANKDHEVATPFDGCLAFVFNDKGRAIHVVVCISQYTYIGADGGGSHVKTFEDAMKHNAFVKIRPISKLKNPRFARLLFVNPA